MAANTFDQAFGLKMASIRATEESLRNDAGFWGFAADYDLSLKRVLEHEGGYTNDAADPGGPTNWGITIYDARMYWRANATAADVRAMPLSVAKEIYRTKYWKAVRADELPAGVDYAVFDYGVNSGISRAMRVLRVKVGLPAGTDYAMVIKAAQATDAGKLIHAICDERLAFLQQLKTWPVFGKGWSRRVREVRATALQMAVKKIDEPVKPASKAGKTPAVVGGLTAALAAAWAYMEAHPLVLVLGGLAIATGLVLYLTRYRKP